MPVVKQEDFNRNAAMRGARVLTKSIIIKEGEMKKALKVFFSKFMVVTTAVAVLTILSAGAVYAGDLPPVPDSIKKLGVLRVGTKCDYPPEGFIDEKGKPQGVEVNMARQIAKYIFGDPSKIKISCVTTANRIPSLMGGKIDLIIATMGINKKRKEVIDFTEPYAWNASSVLVLKGSDIQKLSDLKGRTVVMVKGAWQIPWIEKNIPEAKLLKLDRVSDALQALSQKRADAYAHDWAVQLGIDNSNKSVRMLKELYKIGYRGAGVRKGEAQWLAFVNAAIKKMRADGLVEKWLKEYEKPELFATRKKLWNPANAPKK